MNVVDSSAWLEYLAGGANAGEFAPAIQDAEALVVPSIVIYEVFKRVAFQRGTDEALEVAALLLQGEVVDLDADLAIAAADLSLEEDLPMADAVILATTRAREAILWTQDSDFDGMADVEYRAPVRSG